MEKNNGKIAIAIVAMFVVALSVVGFTYAYFTASVVGNTAESVDVTAGTLHITYANTDQIAAKNVVPGWVSDGNHYYDPIASVYQVNETTKGIRAVTDAYIQSAGLTTYFAGENASLKNENYGLVDEATITITNDLSDAENSTAYYAIALESITNTLLASDVNNMKVSLYSGEPTDTDPAPTHIWTGTLGTADSIEDTYDRQIIIDATKPIEKGATHKYFIKLTYLNAATSQNTDTDGTAIAATIAAKIKVIGVAQNGDTWYDEDNHPVTYVATETAPVDPVTLY